MNKPTITINGETKEIKQVKGKDWRIMGEFLDKKLSFNYNHFMDEQAKFIANFFDDVTADDVLDLPLEEIFPTAIAIRDFMINKISEKLNVIEKNAVTGGEEKTTQST